MSGKTSLPSDAAPSICKVTPVMKAAAGDNKKTMAALTSASSPSLPSGTCAFSLGIKVRMAPP